MDSIALLLAALVCAAAAASTDDLGELIVPADASAPAIFGIRGGILIALPPAALDGRPEGGPRGLIRVGLDFEGSTHLVNYIAIEPVVGGRRGLSELERSRDGVQGLRLSLSAPAEGRPDRDKPAGTTPTLPWVIERSARGRSVRFIVDCEPFDNGAHALVEVTLFEKEPLAVRLRTFAAPGSAAMSKLILTATMGNQSRCRDLWLADSIISARDLYGSYRGDGFVERDTYPLARLQRTRDGDAIVAITPDEFDPRETLPFANGAWRCTVPWLAQYWRKPRNELDPDLQCRVNGRRVYWAGRTPIPCGASFENFELIEPFREGRTWWFGFAFDDPAKRFGFAHQRPPHHATTRDLSPVERQALRAVAQQARTLRNGDFAKALDGWTSEGGADNFRVFDLPPASPATAGAAQKDPPPRRSALSTFAAKGDRDQGRLHQSFVVPADAEELRFFVHGGADASRVSVRLWRGESLWRWTSGRNDNDPFEVRWDLAPLRGEVVTLEIVDASSEPWGFIGIHGIEVIPAVIGRRSP